MPSGAGAQTGPGRTEALARISGLAVSCRRGLSARPRPGRAGSHEHAGSIAAGAGRARPAVTDTLRDSGDRAQRGSPESITTGSGSLSGLVVMDSGFSATRVGRCRPGRLYSADLG